MKPRIPWIPAIIALAALAAFAVAVALLNTPAPPSPIIPSPIPSPPLSPPLTPPAHWPAPNPTSTSPQSPTPLPTRRPSPTPGPTPTFYVTLYPYSLESLEGWSFYTDTHLKIAFPYPAAPPRVYYSERKQYTGFEIQAYWDSTDRSAIAWIAIFVWEGFDGLPSLDACVAEIARRATGDPEAYRKIEVFDQDLVNALKRAGAEDVVVYEDFMPLYFALYQGRVYDFGQGFMTASGAQDRMFRLILHNVRFLP